MASIDLEKVTEYIVFCPRCGKKLNRTKVNLRDCKNCGLHLYINPVTTTGAVLRNEKEELLLVKRSVEPNKGWWDIPGGFVDLNENLEDSLRRELKEELNVEVKYLRYLTSKVDIYKYRDVYYQTLGTIFEGSISSSDKLKASDDISGYEFFRKDNFPVAKLAFKSLQEFFRTYLELDR